MIYIDRESAYADKIRSYKAELDGAVLGEIADGESKAFEVKPGRHVLRMKLSWTTSNEVSFEYGIGDMLHFQCVNGLKGARIWLAIIYALFLSHKYIELRRTD